MTIFELPRGIGQSMRHAEGGVSAEKSDMAQPNDERSYGAEHLMGTVQVQNFSMWLDLFRWVAAFAVLLAHIGLVALLPYSKTISPNFVAKSYSFAAGFAHQAVMIFFVLSGFLVGGSFLRSWASKTFSLKDYFIKRVVRLWIVIIPVLVLSYFLAYFSLNEFAGRSMDQYPVDAAARLTFTSFLCTVVFLQTVACPAFAFDAPLWSLASEFFYYFAFPALFVAATAMRGMQRIFLVSAIVAVLIFLTFIQFSGSAIAPYFFIWVLGAYVATMKVPAFSVPIWVSAGLFVFVMLVSRIMKIGIVEGENTISQFISDLFVAVSFANLLISMRFAGDLRPPPLGKFNVIFAGFSFSLYCLHYPLALFLAAMSLHFFGVGYKMQSTVVGLTTWIFVFGYIGIIVISSWLFAMATERHTDRLRRVLFQHGKRLASLHR